MEFEISRSMSIIVLVLLLICVGGTYVVVNTMNSTEIGSLQDEITEYQQTINEKNNEITQLTQQGENYTYHILESMSLLDFSRETRAQGNLYFDYAARIWFPMKSYTLVIENCSKAMEQYNISSERFHLAEYYFNNTKQYTSVPMYHTIIDLYIQLTSSGYELSMLRYNASQKMSEIAELLQEQTDNISLLNEFNETLMNSDAAYTQGSSSEQNIINEIENEYGDFFNPNREES